MKITPVMRNVSFIGSLCCDRGRDEEMFWRRYIVDLRPCPILLLAHPSRNVTNRNGFVPIEPGDELPQRVKRSRAYVST